MKERLEMTVRRRDLVRGVLAGAAATVIAGTAGPAADATDSRTRGDKRKARYQASSAEVQNFYRVNRYPAT